jgi:Family of unknown function (DUF6941)
MNLAVAMLADAARVEGGKLYVLGGGFDTVFAQSYPVTHPSLAVVLLLMVEWNEALDPIQLDIALLDEDDNRLGPGSGGIINVGHPPTNVPGMPISVPLQSTFPLLQFGAPGAYRFRIQANGHDVGSIRFRVAPMPGMPVAPQQPASPG